MSNIGDKDNTIEDESFYILYATFMIISVIIFIWLIVTIFNDDIKILDELSQNEEQAET